MFAIPFRWPNARVYSKLSVLQLGYSSNYDRNQTKAIERLSAETAPLRYVTPVSVP
jgi:hypothetical protein